MIPRRPPQKSPRRPGPRRIFLCGSLVLTLLAATACQHRFPSEQIPKTNWLILPFSQPENMSENTLSIHGWWLGATTVRQNERAGDLVAEILSRQMAHLDFMNLYSSIDLKYYFANKAQRLKDHFKNAGRDLTDEEVAKLMAKVAKIEFARDLGADKMMTGHLTRLTTSENRTFPIWWSSLEVQVEVTDVASGKVEWSHDYKVRDTFASMSGVLEEFANRLVEDLKRQYFLPMSKK